MNVLAVLFLLFDQSAAHVHFMSSTKEVSLSCTSTSPWFFCVWEGPAGERACALRDQMDTHGSSLCGKQERLEIKGNSSMCTLVIRAPSMSDQGEWTCAVSDDKMETVKDYRQLDIVVEGKMDLVEDTNMEEMVEGEKVELICSVTDAYPVPDLAWSMPSSMVGVLNTSSHAVLSPPGLSGLVSIEHHAYYTPSMHDQGGSISCMALQGNITRQVRDKVIRVKRNERREKQNGEAKDNIDMVTLVSGIILALVIILVILSWLIINTRLSSKKNDSSNVDLVKHVKSDNQNKKEKTNEEEKQFESVDMTYIDLFNIGSSNTDLENTSSSASCSSITSGDTQDASAAIDTESEESEELNKSPKPRTTYMETHFDFPL